MSKVKKKRQHSLACYLDGFYCYCFNHWELTPNGHWQRKLIYAPTSIKKLIRLETS